MKRIFSLCLVVALLLAAFPCSALAAEAPLTGDNTVYFSDGSYIVTEIKNPNARDATQSKTDTYYNSNGVAEWKIILTGTFRYNGTVATCTGASCEVEIYDNSWYLVSKSADYELATASCQVTLGKKVAGITVDTPSFELSLTCIKYGVYV